MAVREPHIVVREEAGWLSEPHIIIREEVEWLSENLTLSLERGWVAVRASHYH